MTNYEVEDFYNLQIKKKSSIISICQKVEKKVINVLKKLRKK